MRHLKTTRKSRPVSAFPRCQAKLPHAVDAIGMEHVDRFYTTALLPMETTEHSIVNQHNHLISKSFKKNTLKYRYQPTQVTIDGHQTVASLNRDASSNDTNPGLARNWNGEKLMRDQEGQCGNFGGILAAGEQSGKPEPFDVETFLAEVNAEYDAKS